MAREKLEKFIPLGFLALVILAVISAVSIRKDERRSPYSQDASLDIIGYFNCEANASFPHFRRFVMVRQAGGFKVLSYIKNEETIAKGKPINLSYFTEVMISDVRETPTHYLWKERFHLPNGRILEDYAMIQLNRANGSYWMESFVGAARAGKAKPVTTTFSCNFGEEGKELVWKATLEEYELLKPKF